ncbi:hypothetical protein EVAR_68853_1, partial [Eumeta japonica]
MGVCTEERPVMHW